MNNLTVRDGKLEITIEENLSIMDRVRQLFQPNRKVEWVTEPDDKHINGFKDIIESLEPPYFNVELLLPKSRMPKKAHPTDTGYDLFLPKSFTLEPGETKLIDFGLRVGIQPGYEIQVRNRSGIVWKYHTIMAIGTGSIDQHYRGSIFAPFYNYGRETVMFEIGKAMAQLVIKRTENIVLKEGRVDTNTDRGEGGFGSTG